MRIGKYEVISIKSGLFRLDGGAMFGVVPKVLWNKLNPADDLNRINLTTRSLLLISDQRKILVDTGLGNKFDEKFKNIYAIENLPIDAALIKKGINPEEITDVIITHLHFDHTGGSTKIENDRIIPTFSNAKYYIQKSHFDWALNPSDKDRASFIKQDFLPLKEFNQIVFTDGDFKLDDEIEILISNGHTPNQQHLKVSDGTTTLFYCGDLIPTSAHIPYPYVMSYDLYPLTTIEEKKRILPQAFEENWILFFEHDPFVSSVTLSEGKKGFEIREKNIIQD
ncbi:MAG: MBL fold metallo-hydrolase [Ignavibacteria bacterium]|jgi:glyoxylase-like metal-dependent hydrolase (beta-lactamase superfamily II)|nr:MBL fold metallo-hydrolase [Ignavibacteria bacterium]MDH7528682.1 MBL fold metallo-hydrolase [Ignavibacteria bacterium]